MKFTLALISSIACAQNEGSKSGSSF